MMDTPLLIDSGASQANLLAAFTVLAFHYRTRIAEMTLPRIRRVSGLPRTMQLTSKGLWRLPCPTFKGVAEIGGLGISQAPRDRLHGEIPVA